MNKHNMILIGAGGHAHACIDVIEQHAKYHIAGLVGMPAELHERHLGYTVIATDSELPRLAEDYQFAFLAMGHCGSPEKRIQLFSQLRQLGFGLPSIIAPTAHVSSHAVIGDGSIIMHGAIVNAGARVGENSIINTHALVEHDAIVGDHCHISTGAILNGSAQVGDGSFVGSGSLIRDGIVLGQGCLVGMGLCVRHNQADHTRFVGHEKS